MLSLCGIDVSKDRLDVIVLPEEQRSSVSNNRAGWADLVERLRGCSIAAIGLEASGGYERGVMRALLAGGLPVRQVNPFKLRQFARASGVLAKNDSLDARMSSGQNGNADRVQFGYFDIRSNQPLHDIEIVNHQVQNNVYVE